MSSKLSFSIPLSKSKPKPKPILKDSNRKETVATGKQYVTEFESSKTLPDPSLPYIPPIQNTWRPIKRMKNLDLPISEENSTDDRFVIESLPTAGDGTDDGNMSYGLNLREKSVSDGGGTEKLLLDKLKYDLKNLPEHRGMEEFEDTPVEGFGAALLAGYGWKEGQGIGRNAKEDVKVKHFEKRIGTLGLGFVPENCNSVVHNNTVRDKIKDMISEQNGDMGVASKKESRSENGSGKIAWLRRKIRVRVISKKFKGGRFYLKKGVVVDVVGPHVCDISIDDGEELLRGVDQDVLETALPRRGGPVVVLYDKHKGVRGSLVKKDLDRGVGVVEDRDTQELLNVNLDQIAEYVADASYN